MNTLMRLHDKDAWVIAEERGGLLTWRFVSCDAGEEAGAMALRLVMAYNASAGLTLSRLASLAAPSVTVPLHEALAVLDALAKNDPALVHRILTKIRTP